MQIRSELCALAELNQIGQFGHTRPFHQRYLGRLERQEVIVSAVRIRWGRLDAEYVSDKQWYENYPQRAWHAVFLLSVRMACLKGRYLFKLYLRWRQIDEIRRDFLEYTYKSSSQASLMVARAARPRR